jgi:hypothetical protein
MQYTHSHQAARPYLKGFAVFKAAAKTDHENYSFEAIVNAGIPSSL